MDGARMMTRIGRIGARRLIGPPAPPPLRRGWPKALAITGIVGGFYFVWLGIGIVAGPLALRSYRKWKSGQQDRPTFAWVCGWVAMTIVAVGIWLLAVLVAACPAQSCPSATRSERLVIMFAGVAGIVVLLSALGVFGFSRSRRMHPGT